jgi:chaperonin GroES
MIEPFEDRIVIEPAEAETTSLGGIIIPDNAQEKPLRGTVVAIGPGRTLESGVLVPLTVNIGDEVLYAKYSGMEFTLEGKDYVILNTRDTLGRVISE